MSEETFVSTAKNIHEAILEVMKRVDYVQKKKSPNLNYTFAGEADLIAALRPAMLDSNITVAVVGISDWKMDEYTTKNGSRMVDATQLSVIRFTHAPSGSFIDVTARGEGADTGDKSSNQAQTGAYKYALRQTFMIETGDDPDNDASVERAPARKPQQTRQDKPAPAPVAKTTTQAQKPAGGNGAAAGQKQDFTTVYWAAVRQGKVDRAVGDAYLAGHKGDFEGACRHFGLVATTAVPPSPQPV
jgi:hypothetical protein